MSCCQVSSSLLLNPIRRWLEDQKVCEIILNEPQFIFIEKGGEFFGHEIPEFTTQNLDRLFRLIANENHKELSETHPILSGRLWQDLRVQIVIPPVSQHYCFSIRKKKASYFNLNDLINGLFLAEAKKFFIHKNKLILYNQDNESLYDLYKKNRWDLFLKQSLKMRMNIVISGATSSGKTTFLNACLNELSLSERLIILEDTCEIKVNHKNKVQLLCSQRGQRVTYVSMQDLVQCSLRLRPDRIIIGEIRGQEISDFVTAGLTGHAGVITTIHAENPKAAFMRMVQMYKMGGGSNMSDKDILMELEQTVDIIFQIRKTPRGRRLTEVYFKYAENKDQACNNSST